VAGKGHKEPRDSPAIKVHKVRPERTARKAVPVSKDHLGFKA
jgi:hypothetical protein